LADNVRIVFSQIEDIRAEVVPGTFPYWYQISVALFDPAVDETVVIKKATETSNFRFNQATPDQESLEITEEFVTNTDDWKDPEKYQTKEIIVPLPAAG
jgi:hypothetical protein